MSHRYVSTELSVRYAFSAALSTRKAASLSLNRFALLCSLQRNMFCHSDMVSSGLGVCHSEKSVLEGVNGAMQTIVRIPRALLKAHPSPQVSRATADQLPVMDLEGERREGGRWSLGLQPAVLF